MTKSLLNKTGGEGRIRTFEAFAADLQSAPFGHSGTSPAVAAHYASLQSGVKLTNSLFIKACVLVDACAVSLSVTYALERAAFCQSSIENARPARIFSNETGSGTPGAPDIFPARSAKVSGKLASNPPYTMSGHTACGT